MLLALRATTYTTQRREKCVVTTTTPLEYAYITRSEDKIGGRSRCRGTTGAGGGPRTGANLGLAGREQRGACRPTARRGPTKGGCVGGATALPTRAPTEGEIRALRTDL